MTTFELLSNLPPEFEKDLVSEIHDLLRESKKTLVILDDDPTGTQTVFDVPVLTDLSAQSIKDAIDEAPPVLFLLTNSRALTVEQTTELHQRLGGFDIIGKVQRVNTHRGVDIRMAIGDINHRLRVAAINTDAEHTLHTALARCL